jgi:hypothetical protein
MTERQGLWGLSNGAFALALSGFVWVSLGLGVGFFPAVATRGLSYVFPPLAIVNLVLFVVLVLAGVRLRRRAGGFRFADTPHHDQETRSIAQRFQWVLLAETVFIASAGFLAFEFQRGDLAWSWIAVVIGVHFLPLAWVFRVRIYYVTGIASIVVALLAIAVFDEPPRTLVLGYGMGVVAWCTCAYLVWNAEGIARSWRPE